MLEIYYEIKDKMKCCFYCKLIFRVDFVGGAFMDFNIIGFNTTLGNKKPENIINKAASCPFCDRKSLSGIIDTDGDLILLKNKYNVIEDADQFVIIESKICNTDIPDYSQTHMRRLIRFGVHHWQKMQACGKYETVIFFKNFGPLSGGTLRHPHMQIVGFRVFNEQLAFDPVEFEGLSICEKNDVDFNISTCPRIGFSEFNVVPKTGDALDTVADDIQIAVDYLMRRSNKHCSSYNIFFYQASGIMRVKIMPRFATSPLFIGYNIRFRPSNLEDLRNDVQRIYFPK